MLLALQMNNLLQVGAPPPSWTEANRMAGWAASSDGTSGTVFLDDVTAVPAGAYFIEGFAHNSAGKRYVCLWPSSNTVFYRSGVAVRGDGAMCIISAGTIGNRPHGWAMTARGEVIVSTTTPELVKDGRGQLQAGNLCCDTIS